MKRHLRYMAIVVLILDVIAVAGLCVQRENPRVEAQAGPGRYAQLRASLRASDPDHPLFRPESWIYLDSGLAWEDETGHYVSSPARGGRLRVYPVANPGPPPRAKMRYLRTSEDSGIGRYGGIQVDWSQLVVASWRISFIPYSYFTARVSLGKSNYYGTGPFEQGSQGIGFRIAQGAFGPRLAGIAHNGGPQIDGHESVFLPLAPPPGVDIYTHSFTVTAVSFGDGAVEFIINDTSVGYASSGGPLGYLSPVTGWGVGVRVEITNDDTYGDSYTDLVFNAATIFVYEK